MLHVTDALPIALKPTHNDKRSFPSPAAHPAVRELTPSSPAALYPPFPTTAGFGKTKHGDVFGVHRGGDDVCVHIFLRHYTTVFALAACRVAYLCYVARVLILQ